jgi:phage host-nuclease inhibitor protein Gam
MEYRKDFIKSDGRRLLKGGPRDQQLRAKNQSESAMVDTLISQITDLKAEVSRLKSPGPGELANSKGMYTPEQVDEEIRRAVSQAMAEAAVAFKKNNPNANPEIEKLIKIYKEQIVDLQKNNDDFSRMHNAIISENGKLKDKIKQLEQELVDVIDLKKQIAVLEQSLAGKEEVIETLKSKPMIINGKIVDGELDDPDRPQMEQVFVDPLEENSGEGLKSNIRTKELISNDESDVGDKVNKLKNLLGSLPTRK